MLHFDMIKILLFNLKTIINFFIKEKEKKRKEKKRKEREKEKIRITIMSLMTKICTDTDHGVP
jgi:hypothetical protein